MDLRDIWRGGPAEVAHVARRTAGLRAGSRVYSRLEIDEAWTLEAHMSAHIVDAITALKDILLRVNMSKTEQQRLRPPDAFPRPSQAARLERERAERDAKQAVAQERVRREAATKSSGEELFP